MRRTAVTVCVALVSTAAAPAEQAAEPTFGFRADAFHTAFNGVAKTRKTERFVGAPRCTGTAPKVCEYSFTSVIRATVSADAPDLNADEVTIVFARPTHNVKGHSLISYRIYGDVVHVLSGTAGEQARGAAIKKLISAIHTTDKEVVEVGSVRYALDMKRTGVRFVAKPLPKDGVGASR